MGYTARLASMGCTLLFKMHYGMCGACYISKLTVLFWGRRGRFGASNSLPLLWGLIYFWNYEINSARQPDSCPLQLIVQLPRRVHRSPSCII